VFSIVEEAFSIFKEAGKNFKGGEFGGGELNSNEEAFFNS